MALTPSLRMSSGVVFTEAPLAQSTHTVSPARPMRSASTAETTDSTYSSPAPSTLVTEPTSLQQTHSTPVS